MTRRGFSLAKSMTAVALAAADFAVLRAGGRMIPNPGLMVTVVILEVGLFRVASRRGSARAYWVGFEVAGWAYVLAHVYWAHAIWLWSKKTYETWVPGYPIIDSAGSLRFLIAAGAFQLTLSLLVAVVAGLAARSLAWRRFNATPGPAGPGGA